MIEQILAYTVPAMYALLPPQMASANATALLLCIGMQESRFQYRRQLGGPARGFYQFELGGVKGVLQHEQSRVPILAAMNSLRYPALQDAAVTHVALEHNDVLASAFARCLLWTVPGRLPGPNEPGEAWDQYTFAWRPGKPRHETWQGHYALAWNLVLGGRMPPIEGVPV